MSKKKITPFFVIIDDSNKLEFVTYNVMPYLMECFRKAKKNDKPKSFDEFKEFVKSNSMYMYWSRCEYEIILKAWVSKTKEKKIDVHTQIMNNIDVVTTILMQKVL
jgi:hypothetical protein